VALEVILGKAMRKDPVARYPNAQALADDLERFLRGVPILARKESLWVRSSRIVRENRFPIMAAVAVVLAAGVVLSYINFDKQAGETALQSARARMDEARPDTIHLVKQDLEEAHAHRNTRLAACRERAQFALRVGTADRSLLETAFRDTAELVASANQSADEQTIAYVLRGNVALRLGEFAEAETCARKAQELRPDHTHVLTLVAELMKESGRKFAEGGDGSEARSQWLLARDLLLRAIKVDEKFAKAHLELASVYELLEMHDDAHREFDLAIKYDPKDSEARSRYAAFQSGRGNQETANTQLEFAKALNPFAIFTRDTPLLGDEVANSIRRYGSTFRNILPVADGTPDQGSAESRTAAESGPASRPQKSL
jgi:tetratricopeptide (TPR) repeat protein